MVGAQSSEVPGFGSTGVWEFNVSGAQSSGVSRFGSSMFKG